MRFPCELPTYHVRRMARRPHIDGDVHKPEWQAIEPVWLVPATGESSPEAVRRPGDLSLFGTGARSADDSVGAAGFQPTALRVGWTETHLCIAFQCADREIWGSYRERDDPLYDEEVVEAFVAPTGDVAHYYEFEVSPHNVVFDAQVASPDLDRATMTVDTSWDCPGLKTAVQVHGELRDRPTGRPAPGEGDSPANGWSVEIAIPFDAFPEAGAPRPGDMWRANFYRIDRADPPEFTAWSPTLQVPANFHVPARFAYLVFED